MLGSAPVVIVIGLTGGIAAGKSTVAQALGERGAHVIDADRLGHRAYEPGREAHRQVAEAFGAEVVAPDGTIDRKALGAKVFDRPAELERLTAIVWPEIRRLAEAEIAAARAEVVVLEAAVLLEAGWEDLVDEIWVVVVEPEVAVARAVDRGGLDASAARARIDAQLSNQERKARANRVIDNGGDESALLRQVDEAWRAVTDPGAA
ncbi:MAG: dephospho-CoA kinase [Deltaproteobacteria bacterium]|nr:dephospho-CoA kinase [Deltaproteobacteria bacterium]